MSTRRINLTLHGVGQPPPHIAADDEEREVWVTPATLRRVLERARLHPHVTVTLDDGNASDFAIALPLLVELGLSAEFFVCAGRLDAPGYLALAEIREMDEAGMKIGSHGMDHVPWRRLSDAQLRREIVDARNVLEDGLGHPITRAACPFGAYDRRSLETLREAGFERVYTSDGGVANPREWLQPRNTIKSGHSIEQLEELMGAGGSPRPLVRRIKRLVKQWR